MKAFKNLINGQWVDALNGATFENRNPASTDEVIGTFPSATREDTRHAIAAAREALPKWAGMPAPNRGAILDKASQIIASRMDEMGAVLTREEGKTLSEAKGEAIRARDLFRFFGGEGWRIKGDLLPGSVNDELIFT